MKNTPLEQATLDVLSELQHIINALKAEIEYYEKENAELYMEIREMKNLISVL